MSMDFPAGNPDETAEDFVKRLDRKCKRAGKRWQVRMRQGWYEVWDGPAGPRAQKVYP